MWPSLKRFDFEWVIQLQCYNCFEDPFYLVLYHSPTDKVFSRAGAFCNNTVIKEILQNPLVLWGISILFWQDFGFSNSKLKCCFIFLWEMSVALSYRRGKSVVFCTISFLMWYQNLLLAAVQLICKASWDLMLHSMKSLKLF